MLYLRVNVVCESVDVDEGDHNDDVKEYIYEFISMRKLPVMKVELRRYYNFLHVLDLPL
jgi:hypothetical protein